MPRKLSYKGQIAREYVLKFSNASTMAISRMVFNDYPLDFDNFNQARALVRHQRAEHSKNNFNPAQIRSEETKKKFMLKKTDLPDSDYSKVETFIIPKGQNNILILSDIHFPYQDNEALILALNYGIENKVNTIYLNGDILDFYQCSRFTKDRRLRDMAGELEMGRNFLKMLQETFNCPIYYKIGNHEKRYEDYLMIKAPELLGIDDFKLEQLLRMREYGVTLVKDTRMVWRICTTS